MDSLLVTYCVSHDNTKYLLDNLMKLNYANSQSIMMVQRGYYVEILQVFLGAGN